MPRKLCFFFFFFVVAAAASYFVFFFFESVTHWKYCRSISFFCSWDRERHGEGTQIQVRADVCTKSGLCMHDPTFTRPWPRLGLRGLRRSSLRLPPFLSSHHHRRRHLQGFKKAFINDRLIGRRNKSLV